MTAGSIENGKSDMVAGQDEEARFAAFLRSDLSAFIHKVFQTVSPEDAYRDNWHIEAIAHRLTECRDGNCRRLLITQPPRSLKSICSSVAFVAWALGHDPSLRFICVSYTDDLAKALARQFRMVVTSRWYQRLFPKMRLKRDTEAECSTTLGGGRLATSVGGTLTGRGADIIIIDDPLKADDARRDAARTAVNEWYASTLVSRLNDKQTGSIVIVMQRLHQDDLAGYVSSRSEDWTHLDLPAIAIEDQDVEIGPGLVHRRKAGEALHPEREPIRILDSLKAQLGELTFSAQYQQRPVPAVGNLIKRDWLRHYEQLPQIAGRPVARQSG